jgi:hypothetical protein
MGYIVRDEGMVGGVVVLPPLHRALWCRGWDGMGVLEFVSPEC